MQQDPLAPSTLTHAYAHTWSDNRVYWTQAFIEYLWDEYPATREILFVDRQTGDKIMAADPETTRAHFQDFQRAAPSWFEDNGSLKQEVDACAVFTTSQKVVIMADWAVMPGSEEERWKSIILHEVCHLIIEGGNGSDGEKNTSQQEPIDSILRTAVMENTADVGACLIDQAMSGQASTIWKDLIALRAERALVIGGLSHLSSLALAQVEKDRQAGKLKDIKPEDVAPLTQDYVYFYRPDEETITQLKNIHEAVAQIRKHEQSDATDIEVLKAINQNMENRENTFYTRFICSVILNQRLNTEWASDKLKGEFWKASQKEAQRLSASLVSGDIAEIYFDEKKAREKRALERATPIG